jgi:hypothetical protein
VKGRAAIRFFHGAATAAPGSSSNVDGGLYDMDFTAATGILADIGLPKFERHGVGKVLHFSLAVWSSGESWLRFGA